jgi:hypothetical protein
MTAGKTLETFQTITYGHQIVMHHKERKEDAHLDKAENRRDRRGPGNQQLRLRRLSVSQYAAARGPGAGTVNAQDHRAGRRRWRRFSSVEL